MSLIRKAKILKEKHKNIVNTVYAKAYTANSGDIVFANDFYLELNGKFKMVYITYHGEDIKLLKTDYPGLSIKHKNKKIIIRNLLKVDIKNNILFQYEGNILFIESVRVFKWSEQSILAEIENPRNIVDINYDANIISSSTFKFITNIERGFGNKNDILKANKDRKILKSKISHGVVVGLYTNGRKFMYKGKRYKGNYHYNSRTKQFMTGYEHTIRSVKLDKIFKLRRRNGL